MPEQLVESIRVCETTGLPVVCEANGLPVVCYPRETVTLLSFVGRMHLRTRTVTEDLRCGSWYTGDASLAGNNVIAINGEYVQGGVSRGDPAGWSAATFADVLLTPTSGVYLFETELGQKTLSGTGFNDSRFVMAVRRGTSETVFEGRRAAFNVPPYLGCNCPRTTTGTPNCCFPYGDPFTVNYEDADSEWNGVWLGCIAPCSHSDADIRAARVAGAHLLGIETLTITIGARLTDVQVLQIHNGTGLMGVLTQAQRESARAVWGGSCGPLAWVGGVFPTRVTLGWSPRALGGVTDPAIIQAPGSSTWRLHYQTVQEVLHGGYQNTNAACHNYRNPLPQDVITPQQNQPVIQTSAWPG